MRHRLWLMTSGALAVLGIGALVIAGADKVGAGPPPPALAAPFDEHYTVMDLGPIDGVPANYGAIAFTSLSGSLLIGGDAASADGQIYLVPVMRDGQSHITGFAEPIAFPDAPYIDGGLTIGPGGVVFYSRYDPPNVEFGQILFTGIASPASAGILVDKVIDLAPLGVEGSGGGLNFVPSGFPGAGMLKLTSYNTGDWYEIALSPAGDGTYDATGASNRADLPEGSEGFVFVQPGLPGFGTTPEVLINEYDDSSIAAYELDANGDPIPDTRQTFLTGISGPVGAAFDPIAGDLLISDYNTNRIYRVSGFPPPPALIKGDNNCDGTINALDALSGLQFIAGLAVNQEFGCIALGEPFLAVVPLGEVPLFGDIDCDGDVDAVDSLLILTFVAGLPVNLPQFCEPLEQP